MSKLSNKDLLVIYEKKCKRDKIQKIILIVIILILLLFWIVSWKLGVIGHINKPIINEEMKTIKLTDGNEELDFSTDLNIFANVKFNGDNIISPNSSGKYIFVVENLSDENIIYDIKFNDEMSNLINMKYRLKLDNSYISGNIDCYVSVDKLSVKDIKLSANSENIFTLEWYWEGNNDSADTYVGSLNSNEYYTLNLDFLFE